MKKLLFTFKSLIIVLLTITWLSSCSKEENVDSDLASQVTGTYVGTGELTYSGLEIEKWVGMKIDVHRSSSDFVLVSLKEADNSLLLDEDAFQIMQTSRGEFVLSSQEFSSVRIEIDKKGNMEYFNPSISVDGESGYTISFEGKLDR